MKINQALDIQTYIQAAEFKRIGNRAVRQAQEKNRRLGIPNVYSHNGQIYYELANGDLTKADLFKDISLNEKRLKE
ncbi:MAG: hypothetical protein DRQ99_09920 [Candidatus Parabeggiatoa sp. nov. 3]|jgi:hypothetical protein|nr:MAG: hypothetical protein DRQ99_09920 [Gammaproteobacteria bacterium]